jgi:transcriptional regulator with XRE-family HTH domain
VRDAEGDTGRRIRAIRLQKGASLGTVARRTGIDISHLSRIETGKTQPRVHTLRRIAGALRVPASALLAPTPAEHRRQPCPVSVSGRCLLDLIEPAARTPARPGVERYTPHQLRLVRQFTALVHDGSPEVLRALEVVVRELSRDRGPR